jgi:hypothetical protein
MFYMRESWFSVNVFIRYVCQASSVHVVAFIHTCICTDYGRYVSGTCLSMADSGSDLICGQLRVQALMQV